MGTAESGSSGHCFSAKPDNRLCDQEITFSRNNKKEFRINRFRIRDPLDHDYDYRIVDPEPKIYPLVT
jgi:hypothetical protein